MSTNEGRRKLFLQLSYDMLNPEKSSAIIKWHALIILCCDTIGHIQGKGKKGYSATFLKASPVIIKVLRKGDKHFEEVLR